jgi:Zn-dependent protease
MNSFITDLIKLAPPLLLALTLHELAHGLVAYRLGDPTAKNAGRLTLNPLKHLDPLGTIAFFIILLLAFSGILSKATLPIIRFANNLLLS